MAIASEHPGLEVTICVDGQPLPEYEDDDEDPAPKTTTKYIEARSDRHFSIVTRFKPPFPTEYHVRTWLSIDGIGMDRRLWLREGLFERPFEKAGIRRQEGEEWVKQKFSFAKLNIVEEARESIPNVAAMKQSLSTTGCITMSFQLVKGFQEVQLESPKHYTPAHLATLKEIPEKALKGDALSHQIVLSKSQKCRPGRPTTSYRKYDFVGKEPFATFHFKYRSLASLRALRLAPFNEPTPVPLEKRSGEDLTPAELRELLQRVRRRGSESASIKQEAGATIRVKRERTINDDDEVTYVETRQRKRPHVEQDVIVID
ncbi:hypothetical protein BKA58DRAFT_119998 [Alternaria rosae]|uniref:uncharacterized protein n=1 Tax=Alternaria rosae TaxID=1187941 RepID=UPI001E8D6984|nr:uncharacterized protein BKA58DRAFT_119998 [Alternaria rosae]KAH6875378.1 hypothetical protein BKA58DRAFT_119998 [Alternaria rosae]